MFARSVLGFLLKAIPPDLKRRLSVHMGVPDIRWSLKQLRRFGFVPNSIMDVGAFRGDWTKVCIEIFPEARITCIEPQDGLQARLQELARRHPNIRIIQTLLGRSVNESVPFIEQGPGSSVLLTSAPGTIKKMTTIDKLIENDFCSAPEFLKLDAQGYEVEILEGYTKDFSACQVIQCELSILPLVPQAPLLSDVVPYLHNRGFVMFDIEEIIHSPSDGAVWQIDALFCRADSYLRNQRVWTKEV
jgi:FkbM family methyltransferase